MNVDARDIVGRYLYYFGLWEPNLTAWLEERLHPGDLFIDVGANIGYYSILASRLVGDTGMVLAIEPEPSIYKTLQCNVRANQLNNVRFVNAAAWDKEDILKIFARPGAPEGRTSVVPVMAEPAVMEESGETIAMPLSQLVTQEEITRARVVKIDVEGAEWQVICGLTPLLDTARADIEIVVEINRLALLHNAKTLSDVFALFKRWGFYPYCIKNTYAGSSYIGRAEPDRPQRVSDGDAANSNDFVFSRTYADVL